ncbi:MAG: hypothetical protein H7282_00320 [Cytophagaceae bacterium]|nr:hypothetical protein [Cytophagaceae bacterium]
MKKLLPFLILFHASFLLQSQTAKDIFTNSTYTWLGIDYSQVKLIGYFSQF